MAIPFLLSCAFLAQAPSASAQAAAPPVTADLAGLARLIECRQCSVADYTAFTEALQEEGTLARLGMTKVEQGNPLLEEYRLKTPIQVFRRNTARVCFGSAGVMAILEGVKAEHLARELDLAPFLQASGQARYVKTLKDRYEALGESGLKTREIIRLGVSAVASHPGCVLAGCEYRVEVQ
jgi:hypothetical protein